MTSNNVVINKVPLAELNSRINKFRKLMTQNFPKWEFAIISNKINMYYFTGTMQDGAFVVRKNDATLWVRRDFERAGQESLLEDIRPMKSFKDLKAVYEKLPDVVYWEEKTTTLEWEKRFLKYFPFEESVGIDDIISDLRMIKSDYEIGLMRKAGDLHRVVLDEIAQNFIQEGISEVDLAVNIYAEMLHRGSHGVIRFNLPLGEGALGIASFGTSGLSKTAFDGPGGTLGTCAAVQAIGSASKKLTKGQLVYLDMPCGIEGYNTDKTVVYYYGNLDEDPNQDLIKNAYEHCLLLERLTVGLLKPGMVLEDVYEQVMEKFDARYADGFMNGGKFLGHSVGLVMDERPVIAKGFKDKVEVGMVFAIEPKIALPGIGMVGIENTYLITDTGAESLTGAQYPLRCL